MSARTLVGAASMAGVLFLLSGCGGGDGADAARSDTTAGAAAPADTAAAAPAPAAAAGGGSGSASPKLVALGDSIFHGQVGGAACTACHGPDAKGTPVGPNLTDKEWLNTDGTYEGIVKTVTTGVPQPKKAPAPMPPKGGATLTDAQVRAVAAYVYSLSHPS